MFKNSYSTLVQGVLCLVLLVGVCAFAPMAEAATYYVPDNFATIQAAIDGAVDGDTILVRPGTYVENINFNGRNVTLRSTDGVQSTVIDGGGNGTVITFSNHESRKAVLDGFTVTNGNASAGGGMYMYYQVQPTIINCLISGNKANSGGGIYMYRGTYPYIDNTVISDNTANYGGGIYTSLASVYLIDSSIEGNTAVYSGGGMLATYYSMNILTNSYIRGNDAGYSGGGYMGYYRTELSARNIVFSGNSAKTGGAVYLTQKALIRALNNTITDNTAETGGGMYLSPDTWSVMVKNTIIYFNSSPSVFNGVQPSYSNIQGGATGIGNIDTDPLFVDFENGDYHLGPDSPCIDAGISDYYTPGFDFDGVSRPQGAAHDIGAYEYISCAEAPTIGITSVSPDAIWPPNNKETEVVVSGTIMVLEGCTLESATYSVDDEYGVYTGSGNLYVAEDGSFELVMTVEASRLGSDMDGRTYGVIISAADEAGDASASTSAVVLHDMR